MKRRPTRALVLAFLATASILGATASAQTATKPTLYKRLGGYDAIAAVTDDFLGKLLADPRFTKFFVGTSNDSKARIRQHAVDQLCNATGGPCLYIGRSMKSAHGGLGITEEEWNATVQLLDRFPLQVQELPLEVEKSELLAIAGSLKGDIVEK